MQFGKEEFNVACVLVLLGFALMVGGAFLSSGISNAADQMVHEHCLQQPWLDTSHGC